MLENLKEIGAAFLAFLFGIGGGVGGGDGTINQLQQWSATTSPDSAITQTVTNRAIKITGVATGNCLTLNASNILTTTTCGTGGGGGGTLGTSSPLVAGELLYATGASTTASIATGTLSESVTGLALSASRYLVGGSADISLDSGYFIPTTTRAAIWDTRDWLQVNGALTPSTTIGLDINATSTFATTTFDYVGIGTASPSSPLEIHSYGTNNYLKLQNSTSDRLWIGREGTLAFLSVLEAEPFHIRTNNTSRLSVSGAGSVGIGTTTPVWMLDVNGDIRGANLTATGTATIGTLNGLIKGTSGVLSAATAGTDYETSLTAGDGLTRTLNDFDCDTASASVLGCLASADFTTFMGKVSSSSIDTSSEIAALVTDETGTAGNLVFSTNPLLAGFRSSASSTIGDGTGTGGLTVNGTATSTNLKVTALTASRLICSGVDGLFTSTCTSAFLTSSISDETGTGVAVFATLPTLVGLRSTASSTIGDGTSTGGLTVWGNSTTTATSTIGTIVVPGSASNGTTTTYIYSKTSARGGAILLEDSDGAGCTVVTALNGVLSAAIASSCPTEY